MSFLLQIVHYNTHGVNLIEKIPCYDLGEARKELAAELRIRRNGNGTRRWYVAREGKRSFYAAEIGSGVGCYEVLSVVARVSP